MQTQLNESLGGSSSPFTTQLKFFPKTSGFDYSRLNYGTTDNGVIAIVDCWETLPGDKNDIKCRFLLDTLPLALPPMTNYKVYVDYHYADYHSLWKGGETFVTKGRNKSIRLLKPSCGYDGEYNDDHTITEGKKYKVCSPMNMTNQLGIPSTSYQGSFSGSEGELVRSKGNYLPFTDVSGEKGSDWFETGNHSLEKVCALQAFMYQKICRHNHFPSNLLQDNKIWFPDDISNDDWRIDVNGENLSADGHFVPCGETLPNPGEYVSNFIPSADENNFKDNSVNIWQNRYAQYGVGRFTAAKPWIVRGEEEFLEADISGLSAQVVGNTDSYIHTYSYLQGRNGEEMYAGGSPFSGSFSSTFGPDGEVISSYDIDSSRKTGSISGSPDLTGGSVFVGISPNHIAQRLGIKLSGKTKVYLTANRLRTLMAFSIKDEIDAQTNGNYNPSIESHWGINPRHDEFSPKYIGGTVGTISFSQLLQTSASLDGQPLGSEAGRGRLSISGDIGRFTAPDYGYIMAVMYIVPSVSYSQGISKMLTELSSDEVFWPEYAELGFEPILNKEIYVSGQESIDNDLWGYTTRASHLKARDDVVTGLLSLPPEVDKVFSGYAQSRQFTQTPKLSNQFITASPLNLRRDFLAFPLLPSYRFQFATDVKKLSGLPYSSVPNRMGF